MQPEQQERIKEVFDEALLLPQDERAAFVESESHGDESVRIEVISLLESHSHAGDFLLNPPIAVTPPPEGADTRTPPSLFEKDLIAGRFEIVRLIAQGGMAEVYEALDLELDTRIALKLIRAELCSDARAVQRFQREIKLGRKVTHPGVCRIFDIGHDEIAHHDRSGRHKIVFLTMALLEGETLAAALDRRGRFTPHEALPLVEGMVEALAAAHEAGVIHRDFKPSNVMISPGAKAKARSTGDAKPAVVVMDFGISRVAVNEEKVWTDELTLSGRIPGTLLYMAPEQLEGRAIGPAIDIYALGLVMYEMLVGSRPFPDSGPFAVFRRMREIPSFPSDVAPDLDAIWEGVVVKCLQIDPSARFQTVREVTKALCRETILSEKEVERRTPAGIAIASASRRRRRRRRIALAVGIGIFALVATMFSVRRYQERQAELRIGPGTAVLLAGVKNETGDHELDSVQELLRSQLEQSVYLNLLPRGRVQEVLRLMKRPEVDSSSSDPIENRLAPRQLREVAMRAGASLVIFGTVSRMADEYKLDIRLERVTNDPSSAGAAWQFTDSATQKKDFFQVVDSASNWIRRQAGEAEKKIDSTNVPPQEVTTDNWEALRLYSQAQDLVVELRLTDAIALLDQAIAQDPQFAMAYMRRADLLDTNGQYDDAKESWQKALQIARQTNTGSAADPRQITPREELRITGIFAEDTGDPRKADGTFRAYEVQYPNDFLGPFYRSHLALTMGQPEKALLLLAKAEFLAPESFYVPERQARASLAEGNLDAAAGFSARVRQLGEAGYADRLDGEISAVKGDTAGAEGLFAGLRKYNNEFLQSDSYLLEATLRAQEGNFDGAASILEKGIQDDAANGNVAAEAQKLAGLAYVNFRLEDASGGRDAALRSLTLQPDARMRVEVATLLARNGVVEIAKTVLDKLGRQSDLPVFQISRLRLQGEILLASGHGKAGLEKLWSAWNLDQERGMLRDYLAHALAATGHTTEALQSYRDLSKSPGAFWCFEDLHFPGQETEYAAETRALESDQFRRPVTSNHSQ